jgi:ubiquinone/menaquinone biosynthesis C-methylase UbiE
LQSFTLQHPSQLSECNNELSLNSHLHEEVREHYRLLAPHYGSRANRTCEETYLRLVRRFLGKTRSVLEVGTGSNGLIDRLESRLGVGCDLSLDMLRARSARNSARYVVAAGEELPFPDGQFDGLFLINVLEHVASVQAALEEAARVLRPDGMLVAVTPNGNWEFWLDLAERWKLKLPEGPHTFLTPRALRGLVEQQFEVVRHNTLLVFPAGSPAVAALVDKIAFCSSFHRGFFQFVAARKRSAESQHRIVAHSS